MCQLDKESVGHMHETAGVARVTCPVVDEEEGCINPDDVPSDVTSKSCHEVSIEDFKKI